MESNRKISWQHAAKAGTIIGLVGVGFSLLGYAVGLAEAGFWNSFLNIVHIVVFAMLLYGFTKKRAAVAAPVEGFTYGRCIVFVITSMLFTGLIEGVYEAVFNNFIRPDLTLAYIDEYMLLFQDMIPDEMFDTLYGSMKSALFNPLLLAIAGIINAIIKGVLIGLITSAFAKRDPDIFADSRTE